MKRLLIIRSASFQQLDGNFSAILARFPDYQIHILTHEHGKKSARKYVAASRIIVYPHPGQFRQGAPVPDLAGKSYDDVLVLVANLSGAGYANVLAFARSLKGTRLHRCNLLGEIELLTPGMLRGELRREIVFNCYSAIFGSVLGLASACWFMCAVPISRVFFRRSSSVPAPDRKICFASISESNSLRDIPRVSVPHGHQDG